MSLQKTTIVVGASENPERYSCKAIKLLRHYGHDVIAVGQKEGAVAQIRFQTEWPSGQKADTVTLYINPGIQEQYREAILQMKPRRIIFNPGTENDAFAKEAAARGIITEVACTLVLLQTGQY